MYDAVNIDWTINMTMSLWLSATEAAGVLRVNRATLYAYVSRGFVRSQSMPGSTRERGYSREDVDRLRRRTEERRDPDKAVARALQWGVPVLESAITLIDGQRIYYRGHDALALARSRTVQEVASLVWTGRFDMSFSGAPTAGRAPFRFAPDLSFTARAQSMLAAAAAHDPIAFDLRAEAAAQCGWRIVELLTEAATGNRPDTPRVEEPLARAWGLRGRGVDVLRAVLILCADHELNVSSFTARCVASAGAHPYGVVIAGLAALEGPKHGGASARVESMLASMRRAPHVGRAVTARLRRGEPLDGFGHPLYRQGDPRAAAILGLLREHYAKSPEVEFVVDVAASAASTVREHANLDFALASAARVLRLPAGAPLTLFAIGRTIGWIGHAIEQYATGQLIRPRAKYVGPVPISR
jgi:citrate synthase